MNKQKILVVHNRYLNHGGEDEVFDTEVTLLREKGHSVETYVENNERISKLGLIRTSIDTVWSTRSYKNVCEIIHHHQPDIIHIHNFFPLISPSIYYAARTRKVPVIQTMHNYRLLCLNAFLFRDGNVCNDCVGKKIPYHGIRHACYRKSRAGSSVVAAMQVIHRMLGTWQNMVNRYIVLSEFARQKFSDGGIPYNKMVVKGYFLWPDPGIGSGKGGYFLYVGRLSEEKGIRVLLEAWNMLGVKVPLKIIGDGPLNRYVENLIRFNEGIEYLGWLPFDKIIPILKDAKFMIVPSLWYEGMPRVILEAYATGTPVVGSDIGAICQMILPELTGLHFQTGNAEDLAGKIQWLLQNPSRVAEMRRAARSEYEARYTVDSNYQSLVSIYNEYP